MYLLHGHLVAKPNTGLQLTEILDKASELVSTAKGCHLYALSSNSTNPDLIWITEIWDSKEDHDASLSLPGVRELISQAIPLLSSAPQKGQELSILGGYIPKQVS
jgi:quinol monooxygenase YgiN